MKSSRKQGHQILGVISAPRAERLLADWANVNFADSDAYRWFFNRYPEMLLGDISGEAGFLVNQTMATQMQRYLRKTWDAPNLRTFDWCSWSAQGFYFTELMFYEGRDLPHKKEDLVYPDLLFVIQEEPPAKVTPVEAAIFHLRHSRNRALHCPNQDCPAPYFFASKKGQKYCSAECAKPTQREAKRRWWADNRAKGEKP
jgi:hypothetical protein